MGAIQRQSRLARNPAAASVGSRNTFDQSQSPIVIDHASFVGLGLILEEGSLPVTVTVAVDGILDGAFEDEVTMEGEGAWRWPDVDGMNRLYNARYVQITWDAGDLQVFQKG